jgi:hypothetical protein
MRDEEPRIVPIAEKGDKTETIVEIVLDGYNDEIVLVSMCNPDQMARCIDEFYTSHFIYTPEGTVGNPYHEFGPGAEDDGATDGSEIERVSNIDPVSIIKSAPTKGEKSGQKANEEIKQDETYYSPEVAGLLELLKTPQDHDKFRKHVSAYITEHFRSKIQEFYGQLVAEVMDHSLRKLTSKKRWKNSSVKDIKILRKLILTSLEKRLDPPKKGRPHESGAFVDEQAFLLVLQKVLSSFPEDPMDAQEKLAEEIAKYRSNKKGKFTKRTLFYWLGRCEISLTIAKDRYWKMTSRDI